MASSSSSFDHLPSSSFSKGQLQAQALLWNKAGAKVGINSERLDAGQGDFDIIPNNPLSHRSLGQQRASLPVFQFREHILFLLERYTTLVVVGETGSGKTTQIPQYLHEAGWTAEGRTIGVLQPRRVAAITIAQRVAEERGVRLGDEVGYSIRFDDCFDPALTRIKFMTEGILIREMMQDPLLSKYSVIMLDEAHERTLFLDIVVGLLYKIQKRRPDLRIIISSATLDAESFKNYFNANKTKDETKDTSTILQIQGRTYPVHIFYASAPVPDYITATVDTIMKIHLNEEPGDVLAFLTGQDEVDRALSLLNDRLEEVTHPTLLLAPRPLYGGLPAHEQLQAFLRSDANTRKVIIATNIAEASVTIQGIVYVVDCGYVKMKGYDPEAGIESLVVTEVSQGSANQRAGRAGRLRPGKCYRLYTEEAYESMRLNTIPEMQRSDIIPVVIQLKALGVDNILRFPFLSPPSSSAMLRALEVLFALNAIDLKGQLTDPLGLQMAEFSVAPLEAKMLLASGSFGCSEEILSIAAMMQVQNVFLTPSKNRQAAERKRLLFCCEEGDHLTLLNVYHAFTRRSKSDHQKWCHRHFLNYKSLLRAVEIRAQLSRALVRFGVKLVKCEGDFDSIRKCIAAAFFPNAARLAGDGSYRTIRGNHVLAIHPSSVLYTERPPEYVVYSEVVLTTQNFMRDVTAIQPHWLSELAPHFYQFKPTKPAEHHAKKIKL